MIFSFGPTVLPTLKRHCRHDNHHYHNHDALSEDGFSIVKAATMATRIDTASRTDCADGRVRNPGIAARLVKCASQSAG